MIMCKRVVVLIIIGCLLAGIALSVAPLPDGIPPALSPVVYSAEGVVLRAYLNDEDKWRLPIALEQVPPFFLKGLICLEDKRFFSHPGVDPLALGRAVWQNLRHSRIVSGGSTISMQVVRLLEPRPRRLFSKFIEALRALQLDWRLSKSDILRLYLTYAPYGGNVEGLAAASHVYFGHAARTLTHAEAAFLYLLPQAPARWTTYARHQWRRARQQVLDRLVDCGVFTPQETRLAQQAAVPETRRRFPLQAAHLADYLRRLYPEQRRFRSTIAVDVQRFLERLVRRLQPELAANGIHNIAILVIENATRAVRGAIGNIDYLDADHAQQIAAFDVPRSPGSTLKPFLYALALDRAMMLPESLLLDVPTRFKRYAPANFSGTYRGLVRAETALSQSLNIPFVRLLQRLGMDHFLSFLELGGLHIATDRRELGLSLIIGGIEVTPLELANLYVNLARGGHRGAIRFLSASRTLEDGSSWLSPGAVLLTNRALAKRDRPDFPRRKDVVDDGSDIRWKTGTSQGRRDAWSIGYDNRFTVLVWLGNLDQRPSAALTGAGRAAPIMFEILEAVRTPAPRHPGLLQHPGRYLEDVEICAFSGDRASPFCPVTRAGLAIRGRVPAPTCRFHTRILRDLDSGMRVLRGCDRGMQTEFASVLTMPPSVLTWMDTLLRGQELLPPFHPRCRQVPVTGGAVDIRSPVDGARYLVLPSFGKRAVSLPLDLDVSGASDDVRCLLNGQPVSLESMAFGRVLQLGSGVYHLFCSNIDGASDEVHFEVAGPSTLPRLHRQKH